MLRKLIIAVIAVGLVGALAWLATRSRLTSGDRVLLRTWFECEECDDGRDFARAVAIGPPAVPVARSYLLDGPPAAATNAKRTGLTASWNHLASYAATHPLNGPLPTQSAYVGYYLGTYDQTYRIRAARLLAAIGGPAAVAALDSATRLPFRPGVRSEVIRARLAVH